VKQVEEAEDDGVIEIRGEGVRCGRKRHVLQGVYAEMQDGC